MANHHDIPFQNITIIGLGLIGGSMGLAIKRKHPETRVTGVSSDPVIEEALATGAIDEGFSKSKLAEGVNRADLVILCNPIFEIIERLPQVADAVKPGAVVSDAGSTKHQIVQTASRLFINDRYFIGGHPMAGSESRGIHAADPLLFENAVYVLTPLPNVPRSQIDRMTDLVESIGAKTLLMEAGLHDKIAAAVSHLPQLLAVTLMNYISKEEKSPFHLQLAAGGFRDMTRIASSPYDIWEDILLTNLDAVTESIDEFVSDLNAVKNKIRSHALKNDFTRSNAQRLSIPRDTKGFIRPHFDLLVSVEDKPGVIADMANLLAKESINIKDIEVLKVREGDSGTIRLSFESPSAQNTAQKLMNEIGLTAKLLK